MSGCVLEITVILALIYAIAWVTGPSFDMYLPPRGPCGGGMQKARQKRTVAEIRNTGTAVLQWIADAEAGSSFPQDGGYGSGAPESGTRVDLDGFREVSHAELFGYLHPREDFFYMQQMPDVDGWKNWIEFYFQGESMPPERVLIRSAGCRGQFEEGGYLAGPFVSTDYAQDLVWADGHFVRWPGSTGRAGPPSKQEPI